VKSRVFILWVVLIFGVALVSCGAEWFTGSWEAQIGLSPQQAQPFSSFQTTLDAGLHLEFLELSSISDFLMDGWLWQEFDLSAELGFVSFSGQLLFDPQTGSFLYAQGVLSIGSAPLMFSLYGAVVGATQSESANHGLVFDVYGELLGGSFTVDMQTYLSADLSGITFIGNTTQTGSALVTKTFLTDPTVDEPPIMFSGAKLSFSGTAYDCVQLTSVTSFTGAGFESETLDVEFMHLFGLPLNIGLQLIYELQTKSYVFTPRLETDYGCLSIYSNLLGTGGVISGLEIYGIAFTATIGGATFTSISNLDTTQYVITTPEFGSIVESAADAAAEGHLHYPQDYWEAVSLVVDVPPAGCGFSFSVETFFSTSTGLLFDWAESTMGITLALGTSVSTSTTITVDATGFTEWTLSFKVSW
jgi:hypothetical protein